MRYEFSARAYHTLDMDRARKIAKQCGARNPREVYPIMSDESGRKWRGTNQPRTLALTVSSEAMARTIEREYGVDRAFFWERHSM